MVGEKRDDSGRVTDRGIAVLCNCTVERKIKAKLPPRFQSARLADFPVSAMQTVGEWLENRGDGLRIFGPCGTGKTHLACAILRAAFEVGMPARFARMPAIYAEIREAYSLNVPDRQIIAEYAAESFLILDDLGASGLSDHERRITLEILDCRINALLCTVITTNLTLQEIAEKMDDRIASRMAGLRPLELAGDDRRIPGERNAAHK